MLTFTSALGLLLVFLAIFSSTNSFVNLPVLQQSATGGLSFGLAEVPINAMYLVLVGLCTSIMWGGIFNVAVVFFPLFKELLQTWQVSWQATG